MTDPRPTIEAPDDDPYLWLEEIDGERALAWVDAQNAATLAQFGNDWDDGGREHEHGRASYPDENHRRAKHQAVRNSQRALFGDTDGGAVERPAIAEQDDVADCPLDDQPIEKLRPFFRTAAKIHGSRQPPECPIAPVEINPVNRVAAPDERLSETLEKSRRHPLQEKKPPAGVYQCPA